MATRFRRRPLPAPASWVARRNAHLVCGVIPVLLDRLPPHMRSELDGINPSAHDLSRLRAEVILLHGRSDNLIPYTESIALADSLPANQVQLFIIDGLAHVDFRPKAHDVPQLLGAMEALLAERMPL